MPPAPGGPPPRGGVPPSRPPSPPTSPPTGTAPPSPAPPTGGVPPSPPTGGVPPSPPTGGVPPSPPTGGVPPSPPTGGVPPSPPTGGVPPSLPTGVLPPPPPTGGVPPSPPTGGVPPSLPTGVLPPPPPTGVLPPPPPTGGVSPTPGVPPPPGGETPQTTPDVSPEVELRRRLGEISDPALVEELLGLYVDALTGLGNARAFEKAMSRAQALNLGVLGLDITNFKALNDLLDWQAGNAALKDVARLLTDAAKATGFPGRNIFRVGGDEFAVIGKQDDLQRLEAEIRGRLPSFERKVGDYNVGLRLARGQDWSAVFEELKGLKPKEQGPRYRDLGVPGQRYGDEGVVGPTEYRDPVSGLPNASALQVAKPRLQKPDYEFLRLSLLTTDTRDASSEVDKRLIATVGRVLAAELGRDAFHITPTSFLLWGPAPKLPLVKEHVFDALRDFLKAIPARRGQVFEVAVETRTAADRAGLSQTEQIFVPEHTEGRPDVTPPPPDVDVYVPEPTTADEYEALIRAAIADRNFDGATSLLMSALTVFPTDSRWGALLEENERARKEFTDGSVSAEQGQGPPAVGAVPTGLHPTAVQGVAETEVGGTPVPGASGTGPTGQLPTPVGATVEGVAAGGKPPEAVPVGGALPGVAPPHDVGVVPEPEAPGGVRVPGGVGTAALTNYRASAEDYSPVPRSQIIEDQARALALLDALEREGRRATPEEQALLARFRGWGTVRHADPSWGAKQFARALTQHGLAPEKIDKILKTVERYPASALTGFYTSPVLVTKIWALVQKLGFKGGRVLEPSAGSGRFITLAPEGLPVAVTAVELDPYSSAVLRHLLPQARVVNQAFQQAPLPSGTFDLVIGNVPFAEVRVPDPDPDLDKLSLHNYFIAKSLKLVRPGGLVALITSTYSMDSKTQAHREFWARNAELLYALRLPAEAHEGELTSVESDLLVFRRLLPNEKPPAEPDFLEAPSGRNEYWDKHPERVLASRARGERPQPMRGVVAPFRVGGEPRRLPADTDLGKLFDEILNEVPERVLQQEPVATANLDAAVAGAGGVLSQYQEGSFVETPSGLRQIINGQVREPEVRPASHARVSMLVRLKERVRSLLRLELSDAPDSEIEQARTELRQTYRSFVDQFGRLLEEGNLEGFESDPDYGLVAALEYEAPDGGYAEADILTRRVLQPAKKSGTLSIDEAYAIARARGKGEVDLDLVAELSGQDLQHVLQALEGRIYNDPATKRWIPADVYLAGNLPLKIEEAELAAQTDPQYQKNVEALRRRLPKQKTANEIQWRLGPGWIEESVLKRFLEWLAQEKGGSWQAYKLIDRVSLEYVAPLGVWKAEAAALNRILRNLGTESVPFSTILRHALNNTEPRVYRKVGDKSVLDVEATYLAKQRVDELHQYFNEYVTSVPAVGERLANRFNALLSSSVPYEPVTDWLRFPGLASTVAGQPFELMDHQKKEIAFLLVNGGRGLVSTQAGGGKTYSLIVTGMLLRQHGITKRPPLFVVPNQTLHQFTYQFRAIYPGARILAATAADLQPEKRAAFIARVATGNWDAVVMPYTAFARIPVSPDFAAEVVADELRKLRQALESSREESERRAGPTERAILRRLAALEARLEGLRRGPKERGIWFEDLGIDQIIVDEAHNFKNLPVSSALIQTAESARAWDLYLKARYVQSLRGNSGLILATGTPLANSIAEIHNYLRYLAPDLLAERGMEHLDQWLTNFAKRTTTVDLTVEGAYRPQSYIGPFVNLSELIRMWRQVAIGHHLDALPDIQRPKASVRNEVVPLSPEIKDFYQEIYARAQKIRSGLVKRSVDNLLKLSTEARLGAISLALVDPERWRFDPANGKLPAAAQKIVEYYSEFPGLVQLVFLDYGVPGSKLNLYEELRGLLVARGIPLHEIAFVHEAQGRDAERLFAKVREGKVRVIVGSTQKGGLGLNIQDRLKVIHNIDYPLRAVDLVQRHARMVRQGNQNKEVLIVNYVQEGSFDAYLMRILERKAQVMEQIATGRLGAQELVQVEDIGSRPLTFAEIKALAAGDPRLLKRAELEQVQIELELRLHTLQRDLREIEHRLGPLTELGERLEEAGTYIAGLEAAKAKLKPKGEFRITLEGRTFENRQDAENFIASAEVGAVARPLAGEFLGLPIEVRNDGLNWIVAFSLEEPLGSDEVKISSPLTKFDHKTVNKRVIDEIGRLPAMLDEVLAFYRDRAGKLAVAGQQRQRIEQDIRAVEAKLAEVAQEIEKLSQALEFGTAPRIEEVLSDEELPPPDPDVDLEPDDPRAYVVPTYPDEETEVDLVEELNLAVATAYPQVAERANAVILGQQIELLPLPREQLVQLVWPLLGQQKIRVVRKLRIKDALGVFYGSKRRIDVLATVAGNPQLANMVLAHEIGHLVDFLPQGTLKRGNILGHIAAMRNYLKHTLVLPGGTPVPQAVRNRLKAMAAVQTVALMGPKPKQPGPQLRAWMDVYQKLYTDLLNDELKSRNVVGLAKVKEELIALSEFWRGEITDEQRAYRVQPDELFADAISVLLLSPGTLANKAPTFWNALLAFAKARVGFWQDYLAIQGLVRDQEARLRVIREASRADYELAEHHRHAARAVQRQARQKAKWRWLRELFSAPGSTLERAYKALTGTKAPPWALERALNLLQQEWLNRDAPNVAFVERIREEVFEPLHQLLGQDLQDAGVILVAQRIALGDRAYWAREAQERIQQLTNISDPQRAIEVYKEWAETNPDDFDPGLLELALSEKFNPYGLTFETAKELLEDFARRWGYAKYHRVIELLAHFRELVYEHAVQPAIDAGLVSPRHLATITRNRETY
ncbi:MAG: diguanylate cyclase, partial [candidate division KSB1 bacterium]|nr:diguanylate cyclase [candidate division KSB1 bacterium]